MRRCASEDPQNSASAERPRSMIEPWHVRASVSSSSKPRSSPRPSSTKPSRSPRAGGVKIGQVLVELGFVTETQLTQTLSLQLSVPWVSLYHIDFSRQLLNRVPRDDRGEVLRGPDLPADREEEGVDPLRRDGRSDERAGAGEIATAAGIPVKPMIASQSHIRSAIRVYYAGLNERTPRPPATTRGAARRVAAPVAASARASRRRLPLRRRRRRRARRRRRSPGGRRWRRSWTRWRSSRRRASPRRTRSPPAERGGTAPTRIPSSR